MSIREKLLQSALADPGIFTIEGFFGTYLPRLGALAGGSPLTEADTDILWRIVKERAFHKAWVKLALVLQYPHADPNDDAGEILLAAYGDDIPPFTATEGLKRLKVVSDKINQRDSDEEPDSESQALIVDTVTACVANGAIQHAEKLLGDEIPWWTVEDILCLKGYEIAAPSGGRLHSKLRILKSLLDVEGALEESAGATQRLVEVGQARDQFESDLNQARNRIVELEDQLDKLVKQAEARISELEAADAHGSAVQGHDEEYLSGGGFGQAAWEAGNDASDNVQEESEAESEPAADSDDGDVGDRNGEREDSAPTEVMSVLSTSDEEAEEEPEEHAPHPITMGEISRILKDRYKLGRTGQYKGKPLKPGPNGFTDAAWQCREFWRRLGERDPSVYALWKLDQTLSRMKEARTKNGETSATHTIATNLKHVSALLNTLAEEEDDIRLYFGNRKTYEECCAAKEKAWYEAREILTGVRENQDYTDKDKRVPKWELLEAAARKYVRENAAPFRIENDAHFRLVRRLYGLHVTILHHVPRRRDVYKIVPSRLVTDPQHQNHVEDGKTVRLVQYKTSAIYGEYSFHLNMQTAKLVRLLEDWSASKGSTTLFGSESNLSNILNDIYEPVFGVKTGCGVLRRKYISYAKRTGRIDWVRQQVELSRKMGQSVWTQLNEYVKHEDEGPESSLTHLFDRLQVSGDPDESGEDSGDDDEIDSVSMTESADSSGFKRKISIETQEGTQRKRRTKVKRFSPNPEEKEAVIDIIRKEVALYGKEKVQGTHKIPWAQYQTEYVALQDVPLKKVTNWGSTLKKKLLSGQIE